MFLSRSEKRTRDGKYAKRERAPSWERRLADCCRMSASCPVAWNENKLRIFLLFIASAAACTWHDLNSWIHKIHLRWRHDVLPLFHHTPNTCGTPHWHILAYYICKQMWRLNGEKFVTHFLELKAQLDRSRLFLPQWHKYLLWKDHFDLTAAKWPKKLFHLFFFSLS